MLLWTCFKKNSTTLDQLGSDKLFSCFQRRQDLQVLRKTSRKVKACARDCMQVFSNQTHVLKNGLPPKKRYLIERKQRQQKHASRRCFFPFAFWIHFVICIYIPKVRNQRHPPTDTMRIAKIIKTTRKASKFNS